MPAAAVIPAIGMIAGGGLSYLGSREQSKAQEEAMQAQQDLSQPQKEQMAAWLPYYRDIIGKLGPMISGRLGKTQLPEAVARQLELSKGRAGEELATYGASKNIMDSGIMDTLRQQQITGFADMERQAIFDEQRYQEGQALSFAGMQPQMNIPSMTIPGGGQTMDWSSLGTMFAMLGRKTPQATPTSGAMPSSLPA